MKENGILDLETNKDQQLKALKTQLNKYAICIIVLVVINIIGQNILWTGIEIENGFTLASILTSNLLSINLIGAFIGLIIALFRYKEFNYKWRWLRGTILTILVLQILQSCSLLITAILIQLGLA